MPGQTESGVKKKKKATCVAVVTQNFWLTAISHSTLSTWFLEF